MGKLFSVPVLLSNPSALCLRTRQRTSHASRRAWNLFWLRRIFFNMRARRNRLFISRRGAFSNKKLSRAIVFDSAQRGAEGNNSLCFILFSMQAHRKKAYHGRRESGSGGWRNAKRIMHNRKCEKRRRRCSSILRSSVFMLSCE